MTSMSMRDKLTVLVQTSPIPSHPSTALIEALFRSFAKADGLLESRVIILADGCEEIGSACCGGVATSPTDNDGRGGGGDDDDSDDVIAKDSDYGREQENIKHGKASSETASNYRQFLSKLKDLVESQTPPICPVKGGGVELLQLTKRHGSAPAIRHAMETVVTTPLVMVCQHDNFFVNDAPLRQIVDAMCDVPGLGINATCIHFLSTSTMNYQQKVKRRYGLHLPPVHVQGLEYPLVPLAFWYGRSHVTYSSYVRDYALNRDLPKGSHLEELLGQAQLNAIIRDPKSHKACGTYVLDQQIEVIYHLSGRRARRATSVREQEQQQQQQTMDRARNDGMVHTQVKVMKGAFTSARTCRATVPGLTFPLNGGELDGKDLPNKFKGRCFHCNERGHSKMHCPHITTTEKGCTEVIDLS